MNPFRKINSKLRLLEGRIDLLLKYLGIEIDKVTEHERLVEQRKWLFGEELREATPLKKQRKHKK